MSPDQEYQIKLEFLEEATEYLAQIESQLLGLSNGNIKGKQLDSLLRAAHSIKGGAAMMGFEILSDLAHRLEDCFKVLKTGTPEGVKEDLERLLLRAVDGLGQISAFHRQGQEIEENWLETEINPVFEQLHGLLGDPQEEQLILPSEGATEDMTCLLFQTEVETCLQGLEDILDKPEQFNLSQEFTDAAQELGSLGEILDLPAFSQFCDSVAQHLNSLPEETEEIARLALQQWRRSQSLILIGQVEALPTQLNQVISEEQEDILVEFEPSEVSVESAESLFELEDLAQESQDLFSSLIAQTIQEQDQDSAATSEESEFLPASTLDPSEVQPNRQLETLNPTPDEESAEQNIRVPVRQLEQLGDLLGELTIERNGLNLQLKNLRQLLGKLQHRVGLLEKSNSELREAYDQVNLETKPKPLAGLLVGSQNSGSSHLTNNLSHADFDFDLLEMDRFSHLHLLSGEIMDNIVQVQEVNSDLETNLNETERTSRNLTRTAKLMQANVSKLRMRPLSDLVARFPRALRDLELEYGKEVDLQVRGGNTLIDRTILESLSNPLLQLFRNAFAHGIEDPVTRRSRGKPERGTIEISATYRGNQTVIGVRDDGAGINWDKVKEKAVEMGLDAAELAKTSDRELLELIFEPGFSTAEQVTGLSGRGVGMDVVRTNLQQIRGEIHVDTQPGLGTTFTLTVPFRLSVLQVLLVESEGMLLAFPSNSVEEMLPLQPDLLISYGGKEVLNWEGDIVPVIPLNQWLHYPRRARRLETESFPEIDGQSLLLTSRHEDLVALQVDRYWGEQEVTVRPVEGKLKMPAGFSGCTILGDGRVVPLIDIFSLLEWIEYRHLKENTEIEETSLSFQQSWLESDFELIPQLPPSPEKDTQTNTIMVVDDSITVRRFLALTLEKAGYRVEQAKDGQDALEKLNSGIHIQAMICDIEMPRLDGYGVLAEVKSNPNYQQIPVVMLTSRSGDKHRQLAMNLGANDYLTKPFQEQELLQILQGVLSS